MKNKLQVKTLKTLPKGQHYDGGGLYLDVESPGRGVWRYDYRLEGKRRTYTIGAFPDEVSLTDARIEHQRVWKQVAAGLDPVAERKRSKLAHAAATLAGRMTPESDELGKWIDAYILWASPGWSIRHTQKVKQKIDLHLRQNQLGKLLLELPIGSIGPREISPVLQTIPRDAATRIAGYLSATFVYAGTHGRVQADPLTIARKSIPKPKRKEKTGQPAIIDLPELAKILKHADRLDMAKSLYGAHFLISRTCQRIDVVVSARHRDIDLKAREWKIPREASEDGTHKGMKSKDGRNKFHLVPLADQVVAFLSQLPEPEDPENDWLFPSDRSTSGHITAEGVEKLYSERLGLTGQHVPHGWRSALMSNCNEAMTESKDGVPVHRFDPFDSKAVLDHKMPDDLQAAYDRGQRKHIKRIVLQWWADQLDEALRSAGSGKVVKLPARKRA